MPTDLVEWRKQYYEKNKEKMMATSKEYYEKNKDKCKAATKANKLKNIETDPNYYNKKSSENYYKSKDYYKQYYQNNREAIILRQKEYYYKTKGSDPSKPTFNKSKYAKGSALALKRAFIESQLADLLIKKEAFKKKLAEEAATNNNVSIL